LIIPEFISFGCLILLVIRGKSKRKRGNTNQREMITHSRSKTQEIDSEIGGDPRSDIVADRAYLTSSISGTLKTAFD